MKQHSTYRPAASKRGPENWQNYQGVTFGVRLLPEERGSPIGWYRSSAFKQVRHLLKAVAGVHGPAFIVVRNPTTTSNLAGSAGSQPQDPTRA